MVMLDSRSDRMSTRAPPAIAADASALYARNLLAFSGLLLDKEGALAPDHEDEILKAALVVSGGKIVHPALAGS